jgi:ceramide glucosyltransferase
LFAAFVTLVSIVFLVQLAVTHRRAVRALLRRDAERPPYLAAYPSVTVVRPVKGVDVEQEDNFRAALDTGYPGEIETIFVFEDEDDPAYALARDAIEHHRRSGGHGAARIVFAGKPPSGRTGKINNMIAGAAEAKGTFIGFGDSDSRPDTQVLMNLIEHFGADERAGAVFAPAVTPSPPRTPGDVAHHIILNAYALANMEIKAGPDRELPFLVGQLMVFRREALAAIGGVECADGQLVDDMYLGARIVDAGYRNVIGTHPLHIINYDLGFGDFLRLWRRWLFFGRGGMPADFVRPLAFRAVSFFVSLGLAISALVIGPVWAAAAPAALLAAEGLHYLRLHRLYGGAPVPLKYAWMAWVPFPAVIPIGLSMLVRPEVDWRGRTYRVDLGARLRRTGEPAEDGAPE